MADEPPIWAKKFDDRPVISTDKDQNSNTFLPSLIACSVQNLWCLQESARLSLKQSEMLSDPVSGISIGKSFARSVLSQWDKNEFITDWQDPEFSYLRSSKFKRHLEILSQPSPQRGRLYGQQVVQSSELAVFRKADVW